MSGQEALCFLSSHVPSCAYPHPPVPEPVPPVVVPVPPVVVPLPVVVPVPPVVVPVLPDVPPGGVPGLGEVPVVVPVPPLFLEPPPQATTKDIAVKRTNMKRILSVAWLISMPPSNLGQ